MKYLYPKIEEDGTITVYDYEASETDYRRQATADETIAALIFMVQQLQNRLKSLGEHY